MEAARIAGTTVKLYNLQVPMEKSFIAQIAQIHVHTDIKKAINIKPA